MRHSHPGGELGPIVERALDLLIESLMQRRFGDKASSKRTSNTADTNTPLDRAAPAITPLDRAAPTTPTPAPPTTTASDTAEPTATTTTLASADIQGARRREPERDFTSSYIPRATRRTIVERDGLSCSWVDEQGTRCGSRSWLEYDHRRPRAKGGGSEPDNLRLLCRHHNRFAAEREYGRKHVEQTIAKRRARARAGVSTECGPRAVTGGH